MKRLIHLTILVVLATSLLAVNTSPARAIGNIIYVDADANGAFDGSSWTNAYKKLQNALAVAASGDQVWVAEGIYYPDEGTAQTNNDRTAAFALISGVSIYGGFAGTESQLSQRNINAHPTILSGDIDQNDINTDSNNIAETTSNIAGDNSYNVVSAYTVNGARLDGFTITAGQANHPSGLIYQRGGGISLDQGTNIALANLVFSGNLATGGGGGLYNKDGSGTSLAGILFTGNLTTNQGGGMFDFNSSGSSLASVSFTENDAFSGGGMSAYISTNVSLSNVVFDNNAVNGYGGGLNNFDALVTLTDCTFNNNSASYGGAISNNTSNVTLSQVTLKGNSAVQHGGGAYNYDSSYFKLTNTTISGNTATQNGGGIHNYSSSDLVLTNVTLSGNGAASGGGLYNDLVAGANIKNTIIANSASGGDCILANGSVVSSASTNNLLEDNSNACGLANGVSGNIIGTDPNLGPLQNNGGATETHALLSGSAAFNSGANANCPATDQRGVSRPQGATCDMGAYEKKYSTYSTKSVASQDGLILESTATSGAGGTMNSSAAALSLGDNNVKKQYRSILSFNTAALPDNAVISKVTLKLKHISVLPVGTNPISLLQGIYVDIRKGYFDTFPALQLADFNATASKTAGPFTPALSGGWYTISLNNTTFASINKLTNDNGLTQFRLRFKLGDNNNAVANMLNLASGNHAIATNRPTLIIEYYVP